MSKIAEFEKQNLLRDKYFVRPYMLALAASLVGAPSVKYANPSVGSNPETGFDCSGFIYHILSRTKSAFPLLIWNGERHANEQFGHLGFPVHDEYAKPGDVAFYSKYGDRVTHVGIRVCEGHIIHAPGLDGSRVCVSKYLDGPIAQQSGNIFANNPIGIKRMTVRTNDSRWPETHVF